tara:strand:- start:477 stop:764 length:288 start_codon:yes stop_codon:yes gene_type:complete
MTRLSKRHFVPQLSRFAIQFRANPSGFLFFVFQATEWAKPPKQRATLQPNAQTQKRERRTAEEISLFKGSKELGLVFSSRFCPAFSQSPLLFALP